MEWGSWKEFRCSGVVGRSSGGVGFLEGVQVEWGSWKEFRWSGVVGRSSGVVG